MVGMELSTTVAGHDPVKESKLAGGLGTGLIASQTKAVGVIIPPPDIKSIVEKTATFVAKHGTDFEKRILANEKNNAKFNFLNASDPYNAYYQKKVRDLKGEGDKPKEPENAPNNDGAIIVSQEQQSMVPVTERKDVVVIQQFSTNLAPKIIEPPEPDHYTVNVPDGLTALDLDIVKLTAQFVARNGKGFLTGLTSREHMNPQFNFLKPTHSMFGFFTQLADSYSKVLMPPKNINSKLEKDMHNKSGVLERCLKRLDWLKAKDAERIKAETEAEAERVANAIIDWHDFVVVGTVDFFDSEDATLPPPMTLKEVQRVLKEQAMKGAGAVEEEEDEAEEVEMEMEMDEDEAAMVREGAAAQAAPAQPPQPPPEPEMKIVRNYKRPAPGAPGAVDPTKFVVSPITGEMVPIGEMAEHMRISLIDPKWKEQRDAMLSKLRETTKAEDDEIASNIVRLATTRPDIFGSTEQE
eukprot:CAMPEP_0182879816 /NCGR_PEP_ID=MMETSP0034_2-20130328/16204_1 /TAXON_ID=156128 /ORGANISM="Nephroselmis pyriformis, Strain CCMP717" /LENGTH=466 /DNA_ID=CAMNT_0025012777 /DNA_START=39 /DNA_END=1436 /DNA_ORIENTATION=+